MRSGEWRPTSLGEYFRKAKYDRGMKRFDNSGNRVTEVPTGLSNTLSYLGWDSYAAIYRAQPAVRTVVDFIAKNIAGLNIKTYLRLDDTDRKELRDEDYARMLRMPNPETTHYRHLLGTAADLCVYDRGYWLKLAKGKSKQLVRLPAAGMVHDSETILGPTAFTHYYGGKSSHFKRSEIVYFRGYSPTTGASGVSPMETLRTLLEEDAMAVRHRRQLWRNAARREGVIERPLAAPPWSDTARERFREDFQNKYSGPDSGGLTPILEEGMTWKDSSFSPQESEYIMGRRLTKEEVANAFHVPLAMVGLMDKAGYANIIEQHQMLYQDTLAPWLKFLKEEIELQFIRDPAFGTPNENIYIEFNISEKLRGSPEQELSTLTNAAGGVAIITRNEARAGLNKARIDKPEYDELYEKPAGPAGPGGPVGPNTNPMGPAPGNVVGAPAKVLQKSMAQEVQNARTQILEEGTKELKSFLERQKRSVKSRMGAGKPADAASKRWNTELGALMYDIFFVSSTISGKITAKDIGGVYASERTVNYWKTAAAAVAEAINTNTSIELQALSVDIDKIFGEKIDTASVLINTQITRAMSWAVMEAGKQSGAAGGK